MTQKVVSGHGQLGFRARTILATLIKMAVVLNLKLAGPRFYKLMIILHFFKHFPNPYNVMNDLNPCVLLYRQVT